MIPAVLRDEPQFRLLFIGQALSVLGDRLMLVALPFAVLAVGGTTGQLGLVVAAQTLPFLLFGLVGGVVGDRVERKKVLIASDLVRCLVQLVAGLLVVTGTAEWWHLAAVAVVYGTADAFFAPAFTGLLPLTLSESHQIQPANALRNLAYHVGAVVGPVVAAVLLAFAGPGEAFLVDAVTFAISVLLLLPLRPRVAAEGLEVEPEPTFLAGLRGGWREVRERPWVQAFLGGMVVYHVVVLPSVFVLGPVLAEDELGGASAWAAITIAFGIGSIVGDGLLLRFRPRRALRLAALALCLASCQAVIFGSGLPVPAIAALEFVAAIGVAGFFTLWEASLQEHVPSQALSRVSSYDYVASVGLIPIGAIVAPLVADAVGVHTALPLMTLAGVLAGLAMLLVPSVRTLGRPDAPATAAPAP